ncbi:unnamed protein product [Polarella glacialis]|uniref:Uncharacterized protein n=1 Tax=Polarella glacialis TaxID=89957 RepID=A0A813ES32_POLGL|nr:unnamed protein product [Polarella glacialis]
MQEIWSSWLRLPVDSPSLPSLHVVLLWRVQRLSLPFPVHERFVAPFLPGGAEAENLEARYVQWRSAGFFEKIAEAAAASNLVDLKKQDDYDLVMGLWMKMLMEKPPIESTDTADNPLNFAIGAYPDLMKDPQLFRDLASAVPLDESMQLEARALWDSVPALDVQNRLRFPLERLKKHDSLFIGHSSFHVSNPFQPWEDASVAIRKAFPKRCKTPLYNDIGKFHRDDLTDNVLVMDPATLEATVPHGHFALIAVVHTMLDMDGFKQLYKLLKPGGVLVWNTWWRKNGEHAQGPPDVKGAGFDRIEDEVLPLSFTTSPFSESGYDYRMCSTRKKKAVGFR